MASLFDILRKVPRRVLMILKLNDLTRQVLGSIVAWMLTINRIDLWTTHYLPHTPLYASHDVRRGYSNLLVGSNISCCSTILQSCCVRLPFLIYFISLTCPVVSWKDDKIRLLRQFRSGTRSFMSYAFHHIDGWAGYRLRHAGLRTVEIFMDLQARLVLAEAWWRGLLTKGFEGAWRARAGLV